MFALWISTSETSTGPAESEFDHALQLTRSVVHAGRSELRDQPGEASWSEWLQIMVGSANDIIDAACHWFEAETDGHAPAPSIAERRPSKSNSRLDCC